MEGRISRDHDYRADQSSYPGLTQDIDSRPVPQNEVCKYNVSFVIFLIMIRAALPSKSRFIEFNRSGLPSIEM